MNASECLYCHKPLEGRRDKKFCVPHCKSSYQYQQIQAGEAGFFNQVDRQLKRNRKLLKSYNKAGKATVRQSVLVNEGFNPKFFTHFWKNQKGDVYRFVYEFGFLGKEEHSISKYILVKWQPYMGR
ncbi:MAG: hypothetical protein AAGH46_13250 [Bacteroidota bacterium]